MRTKQRRRALALACVVACLTTTSCASETKERPIHRAPSRVADATSARLAPLPLPETAFTSDGERDGGAAGVEVDGREDRFATRRLGAATAHGGEGDGSVARHRGAPVDLDLKAAELGDVFRLLADVGKVNIVVSGDVTGTITLRLRHVPWDQALDVIARAKGLGLERDGNVIIVHARPR